MIIGGARAAALLMIIALAGACSTDPSPAVPEETRAAALPRYSPPPGAPDFCTVLAGSNHLTAVPTAIGTLTVDPADPEARQGLAAAVAELREVLDDVRFSVEHADLEAAVEDLAEALTDAASGDVSAGVGDRAGAALAAVAEQAQPSCEFPT